MIKLKDLLTEGPKRYQPPMVKSLPKRTKPVNMPRKDEVITEALDDFQYERQKLLTVIKGLTYEIDNAHSPYEAGASGHDPKKEKKAIEEVRKFKTKVSHLAMDWRALVRTFS